MPIPYDQRPEAGASAESLSPAYEITPFNFENHTVRVIVDLKGDPWWVAADVCAALDIANPRMAVQRLHPNDVSTADVVDSAGRRQPRTNIINESGLWDLILDSRKPAAKRFRQWVTSEVLPSIRKTGAYTVAQRHMSQIDILRAALDQIEAAQAAAEEAIEVAKRNEARIDAIEGRHDWYSALGFARLHSLPTSSQWLQRLGVTASSIARAHGIEPVKVPHAYFGEVNSYPEWIWLQAYESRRA